MRMILLVVAILGPVAPAAAAELSTLRMRQFTDQPVRTLPYPRSERAEAVWNERTCWSECGAHTAWGMAACLQYDNQGRCLRLADRADRYCQRECRTMGGPYVPDIFDALN